MHVYLHKHIHKPLCVYQLTHEYHNKEETEQQCHVVLFWRFGTTPVLEIIVHCLVFHLEVLVSYDPSKKDT